MTLHTISASPTSAPFSDCLRLINAHDGLLLLGDAVYALRDRHTLDALIATKADLFALADHTLAAGVDVPEGVNLQIIEMEEFVALTERFPRQLAWY